MARYIAAGFVSLAFLFSYSISYAASLPPECRFETQLKNLETAKKGVLEKDKASELTLRKGILIKVVDCAFKDADTFEDALSEMSAQNADLELQEVYEGFSRQLENVFSHYKDEKLKIEKLDIDESKVFAKNLFEWRNIHYLPLAEKIANFMMWEKNQGLIKIAERRLSQIEQTLLALELTENEDIKILFQRGKTNLQYAQVSSGRARQIFLLVNPPDDSLYLIRASLESLSETYRAFFNLSQAVKNAVLSNQ